MAEREQWSDFAITEAFRGLREDRDEARAEHAEMKADLKGVREEMVARFTALQRENATAAETVRVETKKERAENRRATLQLVGVLGAAALAAAGGIIIALLTGGAG